MADFDIEISRWAQATSKRLDDFLPAFALALTQRIQEYTPVLTGRLRASIQVLDLSATQITIGTNVVYARRIEYGFLGKDSLGREYHQIGAGMFTRAAAEADEIAAQVIEELGQ